MTQERLFISFAGLIGSGKSTLAGELGQVLGLPTFYEEVEENHYLDDFYKDMKKHSFALQIYLLNRRFKQHQQITWLNTGAVQDRTIYEDMVFAKMLKDAGLMDERDYQTYLDLFKNMSNFMKRPNVIVFLDVSPEMSKARIDSRGRDMEKTITIEYLNQLHKAYADFIQEISKTIPVIRVNWESFQNINEIAAKIKEEYEKIQIIHNVDWK